MIEIPATFELEPAEPVESQAEQRLAEGYYVANFQLLLASVAERYEDLLEPVEVDFIERFGALDTPAQRLYVRLIMRKGPYFRRDRVEYAEIPEIDLALETLEAAELIDAGAGADIQALLSLLLRDELEQMARAIGPDSRFEEHFRCGRREELISALAEEDAEEVEMVLRSRIEVIHPLGTEVLWVLRLLFFGNLGQDWQEFVLRDLGVQRYESYALSREARLFDQRQAVEDTLELGLMGRELRHLLIDAKDDAAALEHAVTLANRVLERSNGSEVAERAGREQSQTTSGREEPWHPLSWRYGERILARVGRALERAGRLEESLELYAVAESPPVRERRCRVLARLDRQREALTLCERIAADPRDETEVSFAPFFAHRLRLKLGLTTDRWRRPVRPVEVLAVEASILAPPRPAIEWLSLALLEEVGRHGVYSENWLWRSLFGLAFWDVIFLPLPGVFAHPFQLGPLDLGGPDFFHRRRPQIEQRLEDLSREENLEKRLGVVYEEKYGIANALVAWQPQLEEALRFAMKHVPGEALCAVCGRLARDPGRHRRGLPDLLLLSESSPVGIELLEVKAPGDQLRPEQGAWLDHLNAQGVPAKILRLQSVEG